MHRRNFCVSSLSALGAGATLRGGPSQFLAPFGNPESKDLRAPQLFLDDTWIEDTMRLRRVWNSAEVLPEPIFRPEAVWEGNQIVLYGTVLRAGTEWRMYYGTWNPPHPALLCLATSSDGLHWERPKLGLVEYAGSKANNILWSPAPGEKQDCPTLCHDPRDAAAPFKMMYTVNRGGKWGEYVAFSKDGIEWRHRPEPVLTNTGDRTNLMTSRDRSGKFVAYLRHRDMRAMYRARCIWRSESSDFVRWTDPELILRPDLQDDPNTELYGMTGFPYGDLYLGMLERWRNTPDIIEVQLAWSHDGLTWHRPVERASFIPASHDWHKAWNTCSSNPPVAANGNLLFYFGGRSRAHQVTFPKSYGAVGLATLPIDRFAAIDADFQEGRLLTRPLRWPGGELRLVASNNRYPEAHPSSGGGSIRVEAIDATGRPVPGFSGANAGVWKSGDVPVSWNGGRSLNALAGQTIRLVFLLTDAQLFSFRAA